MRYNVAMLAELSKLRLLPFRLSFDGQELDTELTLAAFGNTKSYGGGMLICPEADPTDGMLDATMVASASRTKLIRLFPTVFKGTHVKLDEVRTARARTITVDSPGINAYADGEYVCPLPVEVSAVPAALKILRPKPDRDRVGVRRRGLSVARSCPVLLRRDTGGRRRLPARPCGGPHLRLGRDPGSRMHRRNKGRHVADSPRRRLPRPAEGGLAQATGNRRRRRRARAVVGG
jgi:hypothetical protein